MVMKLLLLADLHAELTPVDGGSLFGLAEVEHGVNVHLGESNV